jgi:queuosine precursor transporter
MRQFRYLGLITGVFTATLLISNTLDTKIFTIAGLALPAGIVLFPLAYVFGDVLTEVYGYAASRSVIWTGFISLLLMVGSYELAGALPAAAFWPHQEAFESILGHVPRIVAASVVAYFAGEFCNSYVVAKMKVKTKGAAMPVRFVLSTIVGQLVDTSLFVLIAFTGTMDTGALISITLSAWAVKVGWEIIALPLTIAVVKALKRAEGVDHFDTDTNFNPFSVSPSR